MEKKPNPLYCDALVNDKPYKIGDWKNIPEIKDTPSEVKGFFGDYRYLSNFEKCYIELDGVIYSSVEKAYQAAKWQPDSRIFFLSCKNEDAIAHNLEFKPNGYTHEMWDVIKVAVMDHLVAQKFNPTLNPDLYKRLLATGDKYLEETNWWNDTFWGKNLKGEGENHLGQILMQTRDKLRNF